MAHSILSSCPQSNTEIETQGQFSPPHDRPVTFAASPLTSTIAYPNNNYYYDVFINHRGSDVKNTFASHLYRRLVLHGFRVFLDKQELQEGDSLTSQIQGAIRTASVQIAVFSPNYAGSSWCLDELLLILKTGATIIPVFYNVKPSDLRPES